MVSEGTVAEAQVEVTLAASAAIATAGPVDVGVVDVGAVEAPAHYQHARRSEDT